MAKSRKRVFPKPPEKLHTKNQHKLGRNSNKVCYEASLAGIYNQEIRKTSLNLSDPQKKMLSNLRKNLGYTYQPE